MCKISGEVIVQNREKNFFFENFAKKIFLKRTVSSQKSKMSKSHQLQNCVKLYFNQFVSWSFFMISHNWWVIRDYLRYLPRNTTLHFLWTFRPRKSFLSWKRAKTPKSVQLTKCEICILQHFFSWQLFCK